MLKVALPSLLAVWSLCVPQTVTASTFSMTREDYEDRVSAIWHGQIIAVLLTLPFEHQTAAVELVTSFPKPYTAAFVDDDWYYEMCTVRAFEKYGIEMSVDDLGKQWLENSCGTWGSSAVALRNLRSGIPGSESGHPRYNRLWWTIGPVFTADLYGALAPGMPSEAARAEGFRRQGDNHSVLSASTDAARKQSAGEGVLARSHAEVMGALRRDRSVSQPIYKRSNAQLRGHCATAAK